MKNRSTLFLKFVLALIACAVVSGLAYFPLIEGRAVNLDLIGIYSDPLIIYVYIASLPFFIALYQAYKLLVRIDQDKIFSSESVSIVKTVKYCAFAIIGFLIGAMVYIRFFVHGDDPAGSLMLGNILIFATSVIATATAVLQRLLQRAVDLQSESDLTV